MRAVAPGAQVVVRVGAYSSAKREDRAMASARQAAMLDVRASIGTLRVLLHDGPLSQSIQVVTTGGGSGSDNMSQSLVCSSSSRFVIARSLRSSASWS